MSGFISAEGILLNSSLSVDGENIYTSESTSSTNYSNLATVGPSTTITVGSSGKLLLTFSATVARTSGSSSTAFISPTISGSNSITSNDQNSIEISPQGNNAWQTVSKSILLKDLSPGSTTISMRYRSSDSGSTFQFKNRTLIAIPI